MILELYFFQREIISPISSSGYVDCSFDKTAENFSAKFENFWLNSRKDFVEINPSRKIFRPKMIIRRREMEFWHSCEKLFAQTFLSGAQKQSKTFFSKFFSSKSSSRLVECGFDNTVEKFFSKIWKFSTRSPELTKKIFQKLKNCSYISSRHPDKLLSVSNSQPESFGQKFEYFCSKSQKDYEGSFFSDWKVYVNMLLWTHRVHVWQPCQKLKVPCFFAESPEMVERPELSINNNFFKFFLWKSKL